MTQTRLYPLNTGQIEWVISSLTRYDVRGQRHPQGIKYRLHHFDLGQVGTIILAVTKLEEPPVTHRGIRMGAGTIDMDPLGGQGIHPYRVLIQGRFKGAPPLVVTPA